MGCKLVFKWEDCECSGHPEVGSGKVVLEDLVETIWGIDVTAVKLGNKYLVGVNDEDGLQIEVYMCDTLSDVKNLINELANELAGE